MRAAVRKVRSLLSTAVLLLLIGASAEAQTAHLFSPFAFAAQPLTAGQQQAVAKLRGLTSTASLDLVTLDVAALGVGAIIDLPDGSSVLATRQVSPGQEAADSSWIGAWDDGRGRAVFFVKDGAITGTIRNGADRYAVTPLGDGIHVLRKIKNVPIPDSDDAVPLPGSDSGWLQRQGTVVTPVDPVQVNILVAYTSAAKVEYVGDIDALIASQVLAANDVFANSNANVVLNLVGTMETGYDENVADSSPTDWLRVLSALQAGSDPSMAAVHTRRDELAADLVMLLNDKAVVAVCGIAYFGFDDNGPMPESGFATATVASAALCLVGAPTFVHEIGHNFGAAHDRKNAASPPYQSYGYGYQYPFGPTPFRTVMAYACTAPDPPCPENDLFSNPDIAYAGVPDGVAGSADVARLIRLTGPYVAAYRGGGTPAPAPPAAALDPATILALLLLAAAGAAVRVRRS